eukprot:CAMPEP_0114282244 /NCGR_PEP_ID=MMETSP0059-20121206/3451_1 /TAXON_ID=36894 /ORGANISM="Pyramimonas parkeae, Strain CCMP726" /LENGTH=75 /DNA_ID=CAMNT_0001402865 /DNA_START=173 /DNA_END=400 /DNA_ORIENTATION=-
MALAIQVDLEEPEVGRVQKLFEDGAELCRVGKLHGLHVAVGIVQVSCGEERGPAGTCGGWGPATGDPDVRNDDQP